MACRAIHGWTASALAAAYVDLVLGYLLLCAATFAFVAAKLLGVLGLSLPCSCGSRAGAACLQSFLLDARAARTSSVLDSFWTGGARSRRFEVRLFDEDAGDEASAPDLTLPDPSPEDGGCSDVKGKGVLFRPRSTLRRRHRRHPRPPPSQSQAEEFSQAEQGLSEENSAPLIPLNIEESDQGVSFSNGCDEDSEITIMKLERALNEERAARAALCLDLEKERSAAATAAEEAMAMILRLQEEKAAIGMEARQYQRMIEEKSAYDEEEMAVLKEIIVRRERENHVLEKEVEAYRWMLRPGGRLDRNPGASFDLFGGHDGEKEMEDNKNEQRINGPVAARNLMNELLLNGDAKQPDASEITSLEFQEKNMVTTSIYSSSLQSQEGGEHVSDSKIEVQVGTDGLYREHNRDLDSGACSTSQFDSDLSVLDVHVVHDDDLIMGVGSSGHEYISQIQCASGISEKGSSSLVSSGISNYNPPKDLSFQNFEGMHQNIRRSCTDVINESSVMDRLCDEDSPLNSRRSSTSAVESERIKLETEVEILRKRLKSIQEGRKKLNVPMEHREKESFQLQLLEEIACQLEKIRKMTEPGKSVRQTSLPPPSSKADSKKRRCRSVPQELHEGM